MVQICGNEESESITNATQLRMCCIKLAIQENNYGNNYCEDILYKKNIKLLEMLIESTYSIYSKLVDTDKKITQNKSSIS